MKYETVEIVAKACCYLTIGFFTPLSVGLAQWANSGEWPSRIIWVVIIASCFVGGASQLLSFLSGSYSDYMDKRNGNGKPLQLPQPQPQPESQNKP